MSGHSLCRLRKREAQRRGLRSRLDPRLGPRVAPRLRDPSPPSWKSTRRAHIPTLSSSWLVFPSHANSR